MPNDDKEFQELLEEIENDPEKVDAIMELLKKTPEEAKKDLQATSNRDIDLMILNEQDWRKRARLAALKIANDLEV